MNKTAAKKLTNNELHANLIKFSGGRSDQERFNGICSTVTPIDREKFEILYIEAENRERVNMVKGKPCHVLASQNLDYFSVIQTNKIARKEKEAEKKKAKEKEA